jgi:hypothetical protein
MTNQNAALRAATELRARAASGVGSVWLDEDGTLRVRVLDDIGAREARAVGAIPVFGTRAAADLEAVRDALADDAVKNPPAGLSGATFEIDESANKVIARYLFEGSGGVVPEAATELGDLVTASVEVASINPQADVSVAGAAMRDPGGGLCTAAWAVDIPAEGGGVPENGVMTAGHCFELDLPPEQTKFSIDTTTAGDTPASGMLFAYGEQGDYGVLRLDNGDRGRTTMSDGFRVVGAVQETVEGAIVCKDGVTTGYNCGEIARVDISVVAEPNPPISRVLLRGLARVALCAEMGDSGAPVFSDFDGGNSANSVAAIGVQSLSLNYPDDQGDAVCGGKVGKPNEAYFMPLSGIDTQGRFFVRLDGG